MNILVADDDAVHVQLVSTRLRSAGFEVAVARDAMQAMMLAVRSKPAVVLLDINMPGGGLQTLRQLKSHADTSTIPVVVVSGSDDPGMPERVIALGAADYLRKPFDLDDVLRILSRVTGRTLSSQVALKYKVV
jgi:CheY-like chemotaxis protein